MPPVTRLTINAFATAAFALALGLLVFPCHFLILYFWKGFYRGLDNENSVIIGTLLVSGFVWLNRVNALTQRFGGTPRELLPDLVRVARRHLTVWAVSYWVGGGVAFLAGFTRLWENAAAVHIVSGAVVLLALLIRSEWKHPYRPADAPVRGAALDSVAAVQRAIQQHAAVPGPRFVWGGFDTPAMKLGPNYAVIGTTGSGKTLIHRMLMASALPDGRGGLRSRAIIYDPKRELYPVLLGMGIAPELISFFQPFDTRSVAWDIAADITRPDIADEIAAVLAPADKSDNPFFLQSARRVIGGIMAAFHDTAPGNWSLNDVIEAASTLDTLKAALSTTADGRDLVHKYLTKPEPTVANIVSTIDTKLSLYQTVARLWTRASTKTGLRQWYKGTGVILLGTHTENEIAFAALNRAIFKRASQIITGRAEENPPDETWVFLDEARDAEELDGLRRLLTGGRSKGAHVVLGFQDLDGLREVYGKAADELVGMCDNLAVLRLNSTNTQEWASKFFGEYEYFQRSYGETSGEHSSSSTQDSLSRRLAVLPQEFRLFRGPDREHGLPGVFATPAYGAWKVRIAGDFIEARKGRTANVPAFIERPVSDQARRPWTDDDLIRLGIKPKPKAGPGLRTLES